MKISIDGTELHLEPDGTLCGPSARARGNEETVDTRRWLITDKGDQDVRRLADTHYSRQTPGDVRFTRNGQNLVFVTEDMLAAWVTFRPTPGKAIRADGLDAWECALFINRASERYLSSELIREAVSLSAALWAPLPGHDMITFVRPDKIRSVNPGYCYKCAGWRSDGFATDGKPRLRSPANRVACRSVVALALARRSRRQAPPGARSAG